jgi:Skp family chaperone for outer membrane proteins
MAISRMVRGAVVLGVAGVLALAARRATGEPPSASTWRAPAVGYYDSDVILAGSKAFRAERARLDRLTRDYTAEAAPLERDVSALRDELRQTASWSDDARRDVESRLAARTIALLVLRSEERREIDQAHSALRDGADPRIVRAVMRLAGERGLPVVVRTDASTRVLDDDAVNLTPLVIAALDAESPDGEPDGPAIESQPAHLQSCDAAGTAPAPVPGA